MNILIYSSSLGGHRQVYCYVIAEILREIGHQVILAVGLGAYEEFSNYRYIESLIKQSGVCVLNCAAFSKTKDIYLTAEELRVLQEQYRIDATLIEGADNFRSEFLRISQGQAPKLRGKVVGIFAHTSRWYPGEHLWTGDSTRRPVSLRRFLRSIYRNVFHYRQERLRYYHSEEYFFNILVKKKAIIDIALVKDERVAENKGYPFVWMPEIYKPFHFIETKDDLAEYELFHHQYIDFLRQQQEREVLFYFGTSTAYRGYDTLLQLACDDPETCFVHCGLFRDDPNFKFDALLLRSRLHNENRLYETQKFIYSDRLINLFFASAQRIVSPHRLTGSSGTMLQALDAGKPVLLPDTGLLGQRTKNNALGMTYIYEDYEALYKTWQCFKETPTDVYRDAIRTYMRRFEHDRLVQCFTEIFR